MHPIAALALAVFAFAVIRGMQEDYEARQWSRSLFPEEPAPPAPTLTERLKGFAQGSAIIGGYLAFVWILLFRVLNIGG